MELVAANEEDLEFGRRVHHAAYREMVTKQYGAWDEAVQDGFFERTWARHAHNIITADDGTRCGYCAIECTEEAVILREIALLPEWQGRGIGSQLITSLVEEAAGRGVVARLNVMKTNEAAKRLYLRLGFGGSSA